MEPCLNLPERIAALGSSRRVVVMAPSFGLVPRRCEPDAPAREPVPSLARRAHVAKPPLDSKGTAGAGPRRPRPVGVPRKAPIK